MEELVKRPPLSVTMPEKAWVRGWLVVGGCLMSALIGPGLVASTFSVFFATLLEALPWSRATTAFAYSLYIIVYGLSGPVIGRLCETVGPKKVILAGAALIATGFALLSRVQEVWQFCLLYGALGITAGMTGMVPVTVLISRWFVAERGLALGLAYSGTGIGAFFLAPLSHLLIAHMGWRQAYLLLGSSAGVALFGTILATVQDAPDGGARWDGKEAGQPARLERATSGQAARGFTFKEALGTKSFWLLTTSGFLFLGVLAGILAHIVPLALDRGLANGPAAFSLGVVLGMGAVGKVGMGYLADRYEGRTVLLAAFLVQSIAILLAVWGPLATFFWAFVILFGIGQGGALTLAPMVLGNLFGTTSLGSLIGTYWLIATMGSLVGPPMAGAIRDTANTYFPVLLVFAVALCSAALLVALIREEVQKGYCNSM